MSNNSESKDRPLPNKHNTLNFDSINDSFLFGNKLQNDGDHSKAVNVYTIVLNLIIKNKENIKEGNFIETAGNNFSIIPVDGVYFNLGKSYFLLKIYDKAKDSFEQAIITNPKCNSVIHHYLGITKLCMGDSSTCIDDFSASLNKDPDYYDSYYMRAAAYASDNCKFQNLDKAISDVSKYLEYQPNDKAGNNLLETLKGII